MPAATRKGDNCTGHDACPSVPLVEGSPNVFINGRSAGRLGDHYASHGCVTHSGRQFLGLYQRQTGGESRRCRFYRRVRPRRQW